MEIFSSQNRQVFNVLMENKKQVYRKYLSCERVLMDEEANVIWIAYIVKQVSWFKSSLLLRIQNKHTNKY